MKKLYYLLLLVFLCCACGRGKYYITSVFRKGEADKMSVLDLDSTYHFYLRDVYRVKNGPNDYVMKANIPKSDTIERARIEVEYLLLSWQHKKAIYISTVPDKYQHYYSTHHFADTLINAYDFSTFHFGKIADDGEGISFSSKDGKKVLSWDIRPFITADHPKRLFIREIAVQRRETMESVILVNKALGEPLYFNRHASGHRNVCVGPPLTTNVNVHYRA